MNFLVTGGAGFIGSAVCRHLCANPAYRVTNLDKLTYAGQSRIAAAESRMRHNYRFAQADICDEQGGARTCCAEQRIDVVMHLAAESHVDRSIDGPAASSRPTSSAPSGCSTPRWNIGAALDETAGRASASIMSRPTRCSATCLSTAACSPRKRPMRRPRLIRPRRRPRTISSAPGTRPMACRSCSPTARTITGPYHFPEKLIPLVILNALEGKPLPVYGARRECARLAASSRIMRGRWSWSRPRDGRAKATMSAAAPSAPICSVVETICDLLDRRRPRAGGKQLRDLITFVTDRPGHDRRYAIDAIEDRARARLARRSENFDSGLAETVDWFLDNEWWWRPIREQRYAGERLGDGRKGAA